MIDVQESAPLVGVLAASPAELPILRQAGLILEKFDVPHEVRIMSSSRNPDLVDEYARTAFERGLKVIVCSTGLSGHLAAAVVEEHRRRVKDFSAQLAKLKQARQGLS